MKKTKIEQTSFEDEKVPGDIVGSHWFSADTMRNELYLPKVNTRGQGNTTDFSLRRDDVHPQRHFYSPYAYSGFAFGGM